MRTTQPQGGGSSNSSGKGGSAGAANHGGGAAAGVVLAGVAVLRAAAMRTLLASVLAPCPGQRPPYLAQALLLFSDAAGSVGQPEVRWWERGQGGRDPSL